MRPDVLTDKGVSTRFTVLLTIAGLASIIFLPPWYSTTWPNPYLLVLPMKNSRNNIVMVMVDGRWYNGTLHISYIYHTYYTWHTVTIRSKSYVSVKAYSVYLSRPKWCVWCYIYIFDNISIYLWWSWGLTCPGTLQHHQAWPAAVC